MIAICNMNLIVPAANPTSLFLSIKMVLTDNHPKYQTYFCVVLVTIWIMPCSYFFAIYALQEDIPCFALFNADFSVYKHSKNIVYK